MLDSENGMGVLPTYFRFFRLDLNRKRIYMLSAVSLTQKLSEDQDGWKPHVL